MSFLDLNVDRVLTGLPMGYSAPPMRKGDGAFDALHLTRQCLGDSGLQRELLSLFDRQAARIASELTMPDLSGGLRAERCDLAHTLKGSARAVGAWEVAERCQAYESLMQSGAGQELAEGAARAIFVAVERARAEIGKDGALKRIA